MTISSGDIVAILQTADPLSGIEGEWWRGRNRSGGEGWFPKTYVEIVKRPGGDVKVEKVAAGAAPASGGMEQVYQTNQVNQNAGTDQRALS